MRALVVDDDLVLADVIAFTLRRAGFETILAHDGEAALARFEADSPAVVILQGEFEVTAEGKIAVHIHCTEKTQVWVDADPFEAQRKFEISLPPGRHKLTLRVEVSDGEGKSLERSE